MSQATEQSHLAEGQDPQRSRMPQQTSREEDMPTERMPKVQMRPEEETPTERIPRLQVPPHHVTGQSLPGQQMPPQAPPSEGLYRQQPPPAAYQQQSANMPPPTGVPVSQSNMAPQGGVQPQQRPPDEPRRRFGFLALLLVGAVALTVGTGLGALVDEPGATTAVPAETVTATATATKTVTEPMATASPTKRQEPPANGTTDKPKPSKTAESAEALRPTKREWAKVVKNPEAYSERRYIIYGQVTQFDSATGEDTFRADTAHTDTTDSGYFDGANTILTGEHDELSELIQGDIFRASVTVIGSFDYDTQMGGNTTVPYLTVNNLRVIGNNG
jgi:hypothetical protein